MNKKYIDQEEWIGRLEKELNETTNEERKTYLNIWINAIKCQPTLDEKEIIRKPFERVVERLEEEATAYEDNFGELIDCIPEHIAIEIIREECGTE